MRRHQRGVAGSGLPQGFGPSCPIAFAISYGSAVAFDGSVPCSNEKRGGQQVDHPEAGLCWSSFDGDFGARLQYLFVNDAAGASARFPGAFWVVVQ